MLDTLQRYLIRQQILGCCLTMAGLLTMFSVLSLLGELERGQADYTLTRMLQFAAMMLPNWFSLLLPAAVLLGMLLSLGNLANSSELIAYRAAGFTLARIARTTLLSGMMLAVVGVIVGEGFGPPLERMAREMRASARAGNLGTTVREGLWLRDGQDFIRIARLEGANLLHDVQIYRVNEQRQLQLALAAKQARFDGKQWWLDEIRETQISNTATTAESAGLVSGTASNTEDSRLWQNSFKPEVLDLFVVQPDRLSTLELLDYIRFRRQNNLTTLQYESALWNRLGSPLTVLAMSLLALAFILGAPRSAGAGQRMISGVMIGLVFFLLQQILSRIGLVYGIAPILTSLFPATAITCIALWQIRKQT